MEITGEKKTSTQQTLPPNISVTCTMEKEFFIIEPGLPDAHTNNIYPQIFANFIPIEFDPLMQLRNEKGNKTPDKFLLRMDPKTKLTDFVSQSCIRAKGLLMSQKAWEVISKFNLQTDHEIYNAKIEYKDRMADYIWLNPTKDYATEIAYEKTVFNKYYILDNITREFTATDEKDLAGQLLDDQEVGNIYCREICIKDASIFTFDLFLIYFGISAIMVSKELLNALTAAKLKGFEAKPAPIVFRQL
jgi:hypothetical protein